MAVAPTAMRAAAAAPPTLAARVPSAGPVGAVDSSTPLGGIEAHTGLRAGGSFGYDTLSPGGRHAPEPFVAPDRPQRRRLDSALFTASSEMFALAFAPHPQYPTAFSSPGGPNTRAGIQHGIATYELTSAVIHNELAPRGEQISVTL